MELRIQNLLSMETRKEKTNISPGTEREKISLNQELILQCFAQRIVWNKSPCDKSLKGSKEKCPAIKATVLVYECT